MSMHEALIRQQTAQACTGILLLITVLMIFGGCSPAINVATAPAVTQPGATGPVVTRFENERKGFLILEQVSLDAAARRDFELAVEALRGERFEAAIALLEKLVALSPAATAPRINLAMAYAKTGKPDVAEGHLKLVLSQIPGQPVASNEYALLLRKAGRFAEAKGVYEQALMLFPEYLPARRNLGILCDLYLNDSQCALAQFELYGETDPGDEQIKLWLAELRLRAGK